MSKAKRDTLSQSRKGRPAINGSAMTAAERKRKQRERKRVEQGNVPSWLRLRQQIWLLVQERFMFANADELSDALCGVGIAITWANMFGAGGFEKDSVEKAFRALFNPGEDNTATDRFPELKAYKPESTEKYPALLDRKLFDVLCDILGESRKGESSREADE